MADEFTYRDAGVDVEAGNAAVELLRHRKRKRLLEILRDRLDRGDYPDEHEQSLDEIAYALARAVDERLEGSDR